MKSEFRPTPIAGCTEIRMPMPTDDRGNFMKLFHYDLFREHGLPTDWQESFFSQSVPGAIRGMHFQAPPHDHGKLVACLKGRILDVVLDLRKDSRTYGQHYATELRASPEHAQMVFVPKGCAHGFAVPEDAETALVWYLVGTVHAPTHDLGVHYDSFGFRWPVERPILSGRDRAFPTLEKFVSPF